MTGVAAQLFAAVLGWLATPCPGCRTETPWGAACCATCWEALPEQVHADYRRLASSCLPDAHLLACATVAGELDRRRNPSTVQGGQTP